MPCTKDFTLGPSPIIWFTMDEESGVRSDATDSIHLPATGEGAGDGWGRVSMTFGAGKYSNALSFVDTGVNPGWYESKLGDNGVTTYPELAQGTGGFSFCFWRYVSYYGTSATPAGGIIKYGAGSHSVWLQFAGPAPPQIRSISDTGATGAMFYGWPMAWEFWHLFYEPDTGIHSPGRFGYQINDGVKQYTNWSDVAAPTASGYIYVYQAGYGAAMTPNRWLIDEMCFKTPMLTAGQATYLYNSGAGRTWPVSV